MIRSKLTALFCDSARQERLRLWTLWMFVFLAAEKVPAGAAAVYENGQVHFSFSLGVADLLCIAVYTAVAILIAVAVPYIWLLLPDVVLFGVKGYAAAEAIFTLLQGNLSVSDTLTAVETAAESVLFLLFLGVLFAGKLGHHHSRIGRRYPLYCMRLLVACFPVTVLFEVAKCAVAAGMHRQWFVVLFDFTKGVLNEAVLDVPYYLLILMLCFVPHKKERKIEEKETHLVD